MSTRQAATTDNIALKSEAGGPGLHSQLLLFHPRVLQVVTCT